MLNNRDMIVTAATIIAETAWLYPILGMIGFILDQGGSPLPLFLVLFLIAAGFIVARLISNAAQKPASPATAQALLGLVSIYTAMSVVAADSTVDLLWGPRMIGGGYAGRDLAGLIIGTGMAGALWYRGVRVAVDTHPQARLLLTFRTGIVGLSISILAELAFAADFAATIMILPFFAVSLAGLAFGRMASTGTWPRTIGLAVAAVIGGGFVVGLIGALFGGDGLRLLGAGWNRILDGVSWVVTVLLVPVLELIFGFFIWMFGDAGPRSRAERVVTPRENGWWENIETGTVSPFVEFVAQVMKYPLLLIAIYILYRLLLWAYRSHAARKSAVAVVDRESIRGQANVAADLINLALGLLPDWMIPSAQSAGFRYPKDKPGITEVYGLYFEMLTTARKRGHDFVTSVTPRERVRELEIILPGAPVARITDSFNAACYGNVATDLETLEQLKEELEASD
jgi:hypothetical protein